MSDEDEDEREGRYRERGRSADSSGRALTGFPQTRRSILALARSADARERSVGLDALVTAYFRPVYAYARLRWKSSSEDARDLVQDFFARVVEGKIFDDYDPARARLRTYLRLCFDSFAMNARKAEGRLRRGGGATMLSLDFDAAESEIILRPAGEEASPEDLFHREWVRALLGRAVERVRRALEAEGKIKVFEVFRRYDLDRDSAAPITYAAVAEEVDVPVTQVTNYLALARRALRRAVLDELRDQCESDAEVEEEARELLGMRRS